MLCRSLAPEDALGIRSRVNVGGETYHLPMLDFCHRRLSPRALCELPFPGIIVPSGSQSCHFYGFKLLNEREWMEFLSYASRLDSLNQSFMHFTCERGYSTLRLTPSLARLSQPFVASLHYLTRWNKMVEISDSVVRPVREHDLEVEENKTE